MSHPKRVIPTSATTLRHQWLDALGGINNISVKNKEWLALLKEDTRNSLMIEGYFYSKNEVRNIIENPQYSETGYKILGYFDAALSSYELAFQQYRSNEFKLSKSIIRQIHSLMFRGDPNFMYTPGEWRKGSIEITGSTLKTPSPYEIEEYIEQLVEIANTEDPQLIRKAGVVHDMFEQIHPFPDGNGRVGRILMNFILVGHGLPNIAIKGTEKEKGHYIRALEEADPIVAEYMAKKQTKNVCVKPLVKMEDIISKSLAISMDVIICSKFAEKTPLLPLTEVARAINKPLKSLRVACSQKKYICTNIDGGVKTHPDLMKVPRFN